MSSAGVRESCCHPEIRGRFLELSQEPVHTCLRTSVAGRLDPSVSCDLARREIGFDFDWGNGIRDIGRRFQHATCDEIGNVLFESRASGARSPIDGSDTPAENLSKTQRQILDKLFPVFSDLYHAVVASPQRLIACRVANRDPFLAHTAKPCGT